MKSILTAEHAKANDFYTVFDTHTPQSRLIELAAGAVLERLQMGEYNLQAPCILCGSGNNGADGMALACMLKERGTDVKILYLGKLYEMPQEEKKSKKKKDESESVEIDPALIGKPNTQEMSEQCQAFYKKALEAGIEVLTTLPQITAMDALEELAKKNTKKSKKGSEEPIEEVVPVVEPLSYSLFVDAVYGTGLHDDIAYALVCKVFDLINQSGIPVVAVDIPSGVHCDTGKVDAHALRAIETVTMQNGKAGILLYPGADYAGKITVADIGIVSDPNFNGMRVLGLEDEDVQKLLPARPVRSCKGTFGRVLVVAGAPGMAGAAYLAAMGAYRMGAGLVEILTHAQNRIILQQLLPEAVVTTYDKKNVSKKVKACVPGADAIVIGCGIGKSKVAQKLLKAVLKKASAPCVIDADALNLIAKKPALLKGMHKKVKPGVIITPHAAEAARLLGKKNIQTAQVLENLPLAAEQLIAKYQVNVLLKDTRTLICSQDLQKRYVNLSGSTALATAGSGDILAGMIGGLAAAQTCTQTICTTAALAAYLHGKAGEKAEQAVGAHATMARDILDGLKK